MPDNRTGPVFRPPDEITPLAGYYESAAGTTGFQINLFNPHEGAVCGGN